MTKAVAPHAITNRETIYRFANGDNPAGQIPANDERPGQCRWKGA